MSDELSGNRGSTGRTFLGVLGQQRCYYHDFAQMTVATTYALNKQVRDSIPRGGSTCGLGGSTTTIRPGAVEGLQLGFAIAAVMVLWAIVRY